MNYIHLRHYHTSVCRFDHPLLGGARTVSEETLNDMAQRVADGESPGALVLALRGGLSMLVGRYLAHWPDSYPFLDDMVGEGMAEIVRLCNNIPLDLLTECGILKVASKRAQREIEIMLNKLRGIAAPSSRKQWYLMNEGKDPIYLKSIKQDEPEVEHDEEAEDYEEAIHPPDAGDEGVRDVIDAFCKIQPRDDVDVYLMNEYNWGRSNKELADESGIPPETIRRRRLQLYDQYLELTR